MNKVIKLTSASSFWHWFDPRRRDFGTWAFILNRISAVGLTVYLFMHLVVLGTLAQGPEAYGSFLALIHNPLFLAGELLVICAGIYHAMNGIRVVLTSFGIGVSHQKIIFLFIIIMTIAFSLIFAIRMF